MNRNKLFLIASSISLFAVIASVVATSGGFDSRNVYNVARGTEGGVWHHYEAVGATSTRHGSREFWANSNSNCLTFQLSAPDGVDVKDIVNHDNYDTYESFYNMATNDERYINPTSSAPFENGNGTVTYGIYPQAKLVNDDNIYSTLESNASIQSNGWYLYRGEYYAKEGDNWYKCEPIIWRKYDTSVNIGTKEDPDYISAYFLISDVLLDTHYFYDCDVEERTIDEQTIYGNNYKYSDIRAWLNGYDGSDYSVNDFRNNGFIKTAFVFGDSEILTKEVDNGKLTTHNTSTNQFVCENTNDKIFLLSYQELSSSTYGLNTNEKRRCVPTDWALAKGAYVDDGHCSYFTRSPYDLNYDGCFTYEVSMVDADQNSALSYGAAGYGGAAIRPALCISIS